MDGVHDLGGKTGFGEVDRKSADGIKTPARGSKFSESWEAKVFAMVASGALAGSWKNSDRFRHGIERINPQAYLNHGYYGRWLGGIETLLVEAGVVTQEEITARALLLGANPGDLIAAQPAHNPDPPGEFPASRNAQRVLSDPPKYHVGQSVVTRSEASAGHTRLPAYARARAGVITEEHGAWVYPDSNAHGKDEDPQYVYTVAFTGESMWGAGDFMVYLDLFEPYLTSAQAR